MAPDLIDEAEEIIKVSFREGALIARDAGEGGVACIQREFDPRMGVIPDELGKVATDHQAWAQVRDRPVEIVLQYWFGINRGAERPNRAGKDLGVERELVPYDE